MLVYDDVHILPHMYTVAHIDRWLLDNCVGSVVDPCFNLDMRE
jgi:hypothetical protein